LKEKVAPRTPDRQRKRRAFSAVPRNERAALGIRCAQHRKVGRVRPKPKC